MIAQVGLAEHRAAVRKLLKDPSLEVRLIVALALTNAKDEEAYNVLIASLTDLKPDKGGLHNVDKPGSQRENPNKKFR